MEKYSKLVNLTGTPGTEFTTDLQRHFRRVSQDEGIISGIVKSDPNTSLTSLLGYNFTDMFPTSFNGVPVAKITAKAMHNGDVYVWAKYAFPGSRGSGGQQGEAMRFKIATGYDEVKVFEETEENNKKEFATTDGYRHITALQADITWNFGDLAHKGSTPPQDALNGIRVTGSLNKNELSLFNHTMPEKSCLYLGLDMTWTNQIWEYMHKARYREYTVPRAEGDNEDTELVKHHWDTPWRKAGSSVVEYSHNYRVMDWGDIG